MNLRFRQPLRVCDAHRSIGRRFLIAQERFCFTVRLPGEQRAAKAWLSHKSSRSENFYGHEAIGSRRRGRLAPSSPKLNHHQRIETGDRFEVSPSGKYLTALGITGSIESIRGFDEAVCRKSMPMPSDNWNDLFVQWYQFSHSEQHVVIKYKKKLVVLTVNCQGRWNVSWETTWKLRTDDIFLQFSPS